MQPQLEGERAFGVFSGGIALRATTNLGAANASTEAHNGKWEKASVVFTREYGAAAYKGWLRREAEIDKKWAARRLPAAEICHLREENYRRMKEEGERWAAKKAVVGEKKLSADLSLVA